MKTITKLGISKIKPLGLNNTGGIENPPQKSLSIKYISCERKGILLNLRFRVDAKGLNLKETKAYLNVFRGDVKQSLFNESVTIPVEINVNGTRNLDIEVPLSFADNEYYKTKKYYRASISIINGNIWALSEGFKIDLNKISATKIFAAEEDWIKAAKDLGINDPDLIKAMAYKETFMQPFFDDYPSTMYERHRFYELYKEKNGQQKVDELYQKMPDLVNPDGGGYHESDFYRKDGTLDGVAYNNYKFEK